MDPNQSQARWLQERRLVPPGLLQAGLARTARGEASDLCELLLREAAIAPAIAAQARAASALIAPAARPASTFEALDSGPARAGPEDAPSPPGYAIDQAIQAGAMGAVYRGRRIEDGAPVAIKLMLNEAPDAVEVERFRREVEVLTALDHPGIVEILDAGHIDGRFYLVMELIEGRSLQQWIDQRFRSQGPPEFEEQLLILQGLAEAIAFCHERELIHRDIKPANILIEDESGLPVLVDFGLIKRAAAETEELAGSLEELTMSGELVGTPMYMSPEQFSPGGSFGAVGAPADIWAFGGIIAFVLTGRQPFPGKSSIDIFQAVTRLDLAFDDLAPNQAPAWLLDLARACCQRDQALRPRAAELALTFARAAEQQAAPRGRRALLAIPLLAALVLAALPLLLGRDQALVISEFEPPSLVRSSPLALRGVATSGRGLALRRGAALIPLPIDESGAFEIELELTFGDNPIALVDAARPDQILAEKLIVLDDRPPELRFRGRPLREEETLGENEELSLSITDDSPIAFARLDGADAQREGGAWTWRPAADGKPRQLVVRDAAGNTRAQSLRVLPARADDGAARVAEARRLLTSLASWKLAGEAERRQCQDTIAGLLGAAYEARGMAYFGTDPESPPIASFRHKKTGLVLRLIPGGATEVDYWSSPWDRSYWHEIVAAADALPDIEQLLRCLASPPYQALTGQVFKTFGKALPEGFHKLHFNKKRGLALAFVEELKADPERFQKLRAALFSLRSAFEDRNRRARLTRPVEAFLIGAQEMSQATWERIFPGWYKGQAAGELKPYESMEASHLDPEAPAVYLSRDAIEAWLERCGDGLRMPSYREWLCASRAHGRGRVFWRDTEDGARYSWSASNAYQHDANGPRATPFRPAAFAAERSNAFGLCNSLGHAAEWTAPRWQDWLEALGGAGEAMKEAREFEVLRGLKEGRAGLVVGGSVWKSALLCDHGRATVRNPEQAWDVATLRVALSIPWPPSGAAGEGR